MAQTTADDKKIIFSMVGVSKQFQNNKQVLKDIYLSFFYLPGGGYGNMWERLGDIPEEVDSLILEFYAPNTRTWHYVWSVAGCEADSLFAHTNSYWQFVGLLIDDTAFLQKGFQFRFRNYCSLDNVTKKGILSNADQWNIDYVVLNVDRHRGDSTSRDLAFVNPATSLLRDFQAMPAKQYVDLEMKDSLSLTITNLFAEELASNYGFRIVDEAGVSVHDYVGGYENVPVYWRGNQYQALHSAYNSHQSIPYSIAQQIKCSDKLLCYAACCYCGPS